MPSKKILIAAGGTGGHVFPGISVAKELLSRGYEVEWLGTSVGLEARLVPEAGLIMHTSRVSGIRGKGLIALLLAPLNVLRAILDSIRILKSTNAAMLVGMGGYVAGPAGLAVKICGKPLLIHEQNSVAGTTNKLLAKIANRVLSAFPGSLTNAELVGNPVREEIRNIPEPSLRKIAVDAKIKVLVFGGSRGARALNTIMPSCLSRIASTAALDVRHQSGAGRKDEAMQAYDSAKQNMSEGAVANLECDIVEFIDDMAAAYEWADIVIARAGALTVSEISAAGIASILVPFPYAIDDHQTANAEHLVKAGAALMVQEKDLCEEYFAEKAGILFSDAECIRAFANNARKLNKGNATLMIADACEELVT